MLNENWLSIFLFSFFLVAITNAFLASFTTFFYGKKSSGHLSHSQLRIKQGNATLEHRINVFAQYFTFSIVTLRVYLITLLLWLLINGALYLKVSY